MSVEPSVKDVRGALDLIANMERRGFAFGVKDGVAFVNPASKLTPSLKAELLKHKDALTWLVERMPDAAELARLDALPPPTFDGPGRVWLRLDAGNGVVDVPAVRHKEVVAGLLAWEVGRQPKCRSCGERHLVRLVRSGTGKGYRCWEKCLGCGGNASGRWLGRDEFPDDPDTLPVEAPPAKVKAETLFGGRADG